MDNFEVDVYPRESLGSRASRRYRRQDLIPSVVYSHGRPGIAVLLPKKQFVRLAKMARSGQLFTFKGSLSELEGQLGIVKDIQVDGLHSDVLHVDFQVISEHEEVSVRVSLKFVGEAPGVKIEGGILSIALRDVGVTCLPKLIPQEITVDISKLNIGDSIHVRDLEVPAGVKLTEDAEETVVSVVAVHAVVEEAPAAAEAVAGEVPAEGAPAEGGAAETAAAEEGEKKGGKEAAKEAKEGHEGGSKEKGKGKEGRET